VREDTLITRCSKLESSCYIDYGTVIEDSSILTNSYIGIWLDVTHAVVSGNKLANVGRNVVLNISDSIVIRENMAIAKESTRHSAVPASGRLPFASWD
jgi:UDP-3-O-[3-hydroxymyristoyl] glucosamine N-acyltransferase